VAFAESTVQVSPRIPKPRPRYLHSADRRTMFPEDNGQSGPIYRKPEASTTESLEFGHDCETNSKSDGMDFRRPLPIRPGLHIQAGGSQKAKLCTLDIQELEVVRRLDLGASKTYLPNTTD
jgi:hypothetical protein